MASYTKLKNGDWGLRLPGKATAGQTITVKKKNGETEKKTIARVLWVGKDLKTGQEISLCSIEQEAVIRSYCVTGQPSAIRRTGCSCGSREDSAGQLISSPRNCRQCLYDSE